MSEMRWERQPIRPEETKQRRRRQAGPGPLTQGKPESRAQGIVADTSSGTGSSGGDTSSSGEQEVHPGQGSTVTRVAA